MTSSIVLPVFAMFVWWFATGAVLLLVGLSSRFHALRLATVGGLLIAAVYGLAWSAGETSVATACVAFLATLLLWGAQEIAFLAGWLTGPRPRPCPAHARGVRRLGFALAAILYHELALLACGAVVAALTWQAPNTVGLWTFATLWLLRQSAKLNLFIGVPVTNAEMLPAPVRFLKSYFARRPVGAFFPLSVTLATAALVVLVQRIADAAATPFDVAGMTLVSTLFALGIVEHWFMLLPLPALTLWGWGLPSVSPPEMPAMDHPHSIDSSRPALATELSPAPPSRPGAVNGARQRLEDQFRRTFLEQRARADLTTALAHGIEPAATPNGRTS